MTTTNILVNTGTVLILEKNALAPFSVAINPSKQVYKKILPPGAYTISWKLGDFRIGEVERGTFQVTPDHAGRVTILAGDMCEIVAPSDYAKFLNRLKSRHNRSLYLADSTTKTAKKCNNAAYIVTGADGRYDIEIRATRR